MMMRATAKAVLGVKRMTTTMKLNYCENWSGSNKNGVFGIASFVNFFIFPRAEEAARKEFEEKQQMEKERKKQMLVGNPLLNTDTFTVKRRYL